MNPQTRTAAARVVLANPGGRLKPEMFVRAVASASGIEGLVVPRAAVLWSGPRSVVFVQEGGVSSPSYRMREVKLGKRLGDSYEILSGIEEGDRVVKQGTFAVDAAAQLTGKYSLMLRPENTAVEVDAGFASAFDQVVASYMALKDALVATDAAAAAQKVPAYVSGWRPSMAPVWKSRQQAGGSGSRIFSSDSCGS
ncbi:HlyD family secretion protein [Nitritalea halalkaliphila LW7]|uniref:HlyD family secretion protein n=1 Tax=Nitritalea halalkaliphila LW7 TaxID=1189621 RepID=I5C9L4_9BACT|nr:HlyD family secretion protein [Nitritalea halalkaliphila]EIM78516.1 HlyD family secretion protein [Nitritalea halalkaliphila LW7]